MGTSTDSTDCSNELRMISQHPHFNLLCPNSNLTLILHSTTSQGRHTEVSCMLIGQLILMLYIRFQTVLPATVMKTEYTAFANRLKDLQPYQTAAVHIVTQSMMTKEDLEMASILHAHFKCYKIQHSFG